MGQNNTWNPAQLNQRINELETSGTGSNLPEVTSADNGKALQVVEGAWAIGDVVPQIKTKDVAITFSAVGKAQIGENITGIPQGHILQMMNIGEENDVYLMYYTYSSIPIARAFFMNDTGTITPVTGEKTIRFIYY